MSSRLVQSSGLLFKLSLNAVQAFIIPSDFCYWSARDGIAGGFTLEHQPEDEDESTSDLVQTNGRAAWFEDLQDEAPRHNIADPDFLFDRNGIIELKHLSSDDLVKITRQIFKIETGGHDLLRGQEELEKFLKRIDRNGRPLYAYFLGKALATGKFESGWGREELLREVLTHDQKKRWISAFRKKNA